MFAVLKRELRSYLTSPVGYSYLFIFTLVTGYIFWVNNITAGSTDTISYFAWTRYILIITIPLLAMKLFPEERKNKTDQILITAPISISGMVMGKFLAAYAMFLIGFIPSIVNMLFLASVGYLEVGIVLGNYIGIMFVGAAFLAIAMLMSVLTESMITAFIMGAFSLAFFAVADYVSKDCYHNYHPIQNQNYSLSLYKYFYTIVYPLLDLRTNTIICIYSPCLLYYERT